MSSESMDALGRLHRWVGASEDHAMASAVRSGDVDADFVVIVAEPLPEEDRCSGMSGCGVGAGVGGDKELGRAANTGDSSLTRPSCAIENTLLLIVKGLWAVLRVRDGS